MKYLVTGGAGFIGSHLVDSLLKRGDEVIVLDDFSTGSQKNLEHHKSNVKLQLISGSVLDKSLINSAIKNTDGCFHFAAAVGVEKILKDPIGSIKTNIHGTENILDAAVDFAKPVLLASTSEIYGKNSDEVLSEESNRILGSPLISRWIYSETKAIDESYANALFLHRNLKVKTIRFFNTVGPRQTAAYGMVIPKFFEAAMSNEPLVIHGDGSQRRIFCHVKDAVRGTLSLWDSNVGFGEAFNLAGRDEIRIIKLASLVLDMTKSKSNVTYLPYSEMKQYGFEDIKRRRPSVTKLSSLTGWSPEKSISEILQDYFESVSRNDT